MGGSNSIRPMVGGATLSAYTDPQPQSDDSKPRPPGYNSAVANSADQWLSSFKASFPGVVATDGDAAPVTSTPAKPAAPADCDPKTSPESDIGTEAAKVREDAKNFGPEADDAAAKSLDEKNPDAKKSLPEDPPEANWWGGFSMNPSNNMGHSKQWYDDHFLWNPTFTGENGDQTKDPVKLHFHTFAQYGLRGTFEAPTLTTSKSSTQIPLFSAGSIGTNHESRFENPITGLPESISKEYPNRTTVLSHNVTIPLELRAQFFEGEYWDEKFGGLRDVPLVGGLIEGLVRGDLQLNSEIYYYNRNKDSGLDHYRFAELGAVADLHYNAHTERWEGTGDIDGKSRLERDRDRTGFDATWRFRYMTGDTNFAIPGLKAWADKQFTDEEREGMLYELVDAVVNPKFNVYVIGEGKPKVDSRNTETLLEAAHRTYKAGIIWASTGLFAEVGREYDTTKLNWEEAHTWRVGASLPIKTIAHIMGWSELEKDLADDFEVDEKSGLPKARTAVLAADASKIAVYIGHHDYMRPQSPIMAEALPGQSIGPGGPGGKDVTGKSTDAGIAADIRFAQEAFGDGTLLNKIFSDSRIIAGAELQKLSISGRDKPLVVPITGEGSTGTVYSETPVSALPDPSGYWWHLSAEYDKNVSLGDGKGYLTFSIYGDMRKVVGEAVSNPISDSPIFTAGIEIGWSPKKHFTWSPTQL